MLIDNKKNGKVGDVVKEHLEQGSKLSIISSYFTIYAFNELQNELSDIEELRLLFSSPIYHDINTTKNLSGEQAEIKFKNSLSQTKIARECATWVQEKVKAKEIKQSGMLPFNVYHIKNETEDIALQGSSNFSSVGLGYTHTPSMHMNTLLKDSVSTNELLSTFDEIWDNKDFVVDIKEKLLQDLEVLYKEQTPEFIYFLTLYQIFKDFIGELDEEKIIKTKTGFKQTLILPTQ